MLSQGRGNICVDGRRSKIKYERIIQILQQQQDKKEWPSRDNVDQLDQPTTLSLLLEPYVYEDKAPPLLPDFGATSESSPSSKSLMLSSSSSSCWFNQENVAYTTGKLWEPTTTTTWQQLAGRGFKVLRHESKLRAATILEINGCPRSHFFEHL